MAAAEVEACALWRSTDFLITFFFVVTRGKFSGKIVFSPRGSVSPDERGARLYQTNINNPQQSWKKTSHHRILTFSHAGIVGIIISTGMAGSGWMHSFKREQPIEHYDSTERMPRRARTFYA
jgi:hypothetical protein